MPKFIAGLSGAQSVRRKLIFMYAFLISFNLVVWILTLTVSGAYPLVLGTGLLAYSLGLRHALDADHIAAIDNVTRKLMQEGQRPVGVGFFFALGHSSIIVALSGLVAVGTLIIGSSDSIIKEIGGMLSTGIAVTFLYLVGVINLLVLIDIFRLFRRYTGKRRNPSEPINYEQEALEDLLNQRGLLNRILRPFIRTVNRSWKMLILGLLFGLGFDTASEVALLGLSSTATGKGMPVVIILLFPLLFAAGMMLVDATDGVLMLGAYGWAFVKPIRKLYYNLIITFISVVIAFGIGTIEALNLISEKFELKGDFWDLVNAVDLGALGYFIIGAFVLSWLLSTLFYKLKKYDALELHSSQPVGD